MEIFVESTEVKPAAPLALYAEGYQIEIRNWIKHTFGEVNKKQRYFRCGEEFFELMQAGGVTKAELMVLMDSVYAKPIGDIFNEIGGVITTLTSVCVAENISLEEAANVELGRCWQRVEEIRKKDKTKPLNSPLASGDPLNDTYDHLMVEHYSIALRLLARRVGIPLDNIIPYTRNNWPSMYEENGEYFVEVDLPIDNAFKFFQVAHELAHVFHKHKPDGNILDMEYEANTWAISVCYGAVNKHSLEIIPLEIIRAMYDSMMP